MPWLGRTSPTCPGHSSICLSSLEYSLKILLSKSGSSRVRWLLRHAKFFTAFLCRLAKLHFPAELHTMHTTHFGEKFYVVPLGFHTNTGDKSGGAIIQPLQKLGSTLIYLGFLHILLWPIYVQAWKHSGAFIRCFAFHTKFILSKNLEPTSHSRHFLCDMFRQHHISKYS